MKFTIEGNPRELAAFIQGMQESVSKPNNILVQNNSSSAHLSDLEIRERISEVLEKHKIDSLLERSTPYSQIMVFDWNKAARLIREKKPEFAYAGLREDWTCTSGVIYGYGNAYADQAQGHYTHLASRCFTPELLMDNEATPCYLMGNETPGWDAHTKWPESALKILNREE